MGDLSATPDAVARAAPEAELRQGLEGSCVPAVVFRVLGEDGALHDVRSDDVLLDEHGLRFEEIELDDCVTITAVRAVTGRSTLPQVFVGAADDLASYRKVADGAPVGAAGAP